MNLLQYKIVTLMLLFTFIVIELPEAMAEEEYTFVGQENYAPFNQRDEKGNFTGLDVDIIQKAAKIAGVKVKIETYPWARAVSVAQNGRVDGVFGFGKTPERETFFYYPDTPLRYVKFAFFTNEHFEGVLERDEDIGNRLIGVVRNYFVSHKFNNNNTAQKFYTNNAKQLFLQVSANRYQIALYSQVAGVYELKRLGITNLSIFPHKGSPKHPSYLAFSRASPRGKLAYKKFSQALKELEEKGVIDDIYHKYSHLPMHKLIGVKE